MKPPPFEYRRAGSAEEAVSFLGEHGDEARPLAGGQSLIPLLNFRLSRPGVLVDLGGARDLAGLEADGSSGLRIGAMVRQRSVERSPEVAARAPLLAAAMPVVAHPQIRNRGTVGGSLAHADPAAELPAVALALDARFRLQGEEGSRWVPAREFYVGLFSTALESGELLAEVAVPASPPRSGWAFGEVARRHGDFALAGVALRLTLDPDGRVGAAEIGLFGVGTGPVLASAAARVLVGELPSREAFAEAAEVAAGTDADPMDDVHASADYRRQLVRTLLKRRLPEAVERARAASMPSSGQAGPTNRPGAAS